MATPTDTNIGESDPPIDRPGRSGKRGRPPTASPDDVLALVTELYLDGQRVDVTVVAARLGLGRATIYRWFGSREALLGEVIARQLELLVAVNRTLTRSRAVRGLLESERTAMRIFTSSAGVVEPRAVACIQALIEEEMAAGDYEPPADPATLAYALVHLRHAFLWNDATNGVRGDYERLHDVSAALLGIPRKRERPVVRRTRRG